MSKCIVITGVSRGLGLALTERLIELGHQIVGCARSESSVAELSSRFPEHFFRVVDITCADSVAKWANDAIAEKGAPDLVLNNAGVINQNASLWNVPVEEFSRVIDVNIKGSFHVIRSFVPAMIERNQGVIANFSSGWGRSTAPEVAPYCATKWGIEGLTSSLAQELPSNMAAVAVNPGIINTDMLQSAFGSGAGSFPTAKEWGERAAEFLLSLSAADNGVPASI